MQHLAAVMSKQADQLLQDQLGLGLSQFKILMVLEKNKNVQQSFISDCLGQTEASISRQIQLLQDKNLLTSEPDPKNRRKHITTLTPKGLQHVEAAMQTMSKHFGPEFMGMGDKQFAQLVSNLNDLHTVVYQPGKTGACDHHIKT